ncbi:probable H/ACA ribonucleoprotein complex subunit 1 [Ctenocephalides felis]|uniref:probable H/ACA ribonucleoprotein complex subunit 1 n=1 Tax=Ctenocephalides felis TaxID=7515 RepID=UPI000E6E4B8D|nr:probable H/ACA ribonucleoprotein complex subunit 1 [Ctenocephalides felis]
MASVMEDIAFLNKMGAALRNFTLVSEIPKEEVLLILTDCHTESYCSAGDATWSGGIGNSRGGAGNNRGGAGNIRGGAGKNRGGPGKNRGGPGKNRGGNSNNGGGTGNNRDGTGNNPGGTGNNRGGTGNNGRGTGNNGGVTGNNGRVNKRGGHMDSENFIVKFIEMYKAHTCLWSISDEAYHNKQMRNNALNSMLPAFKEINPDATIATVAKKIKSIRSVFNKEVNKAIELMYEKEESTLSLLPVFYDGGENVEIYFEKFFKEKKTIIYTHKKSTDDQASWCKSGPGPQQKGENNKGGDSRGGQGYNRGGRDKNQGGQKNNRGVQNNNRDGRGDRGGYNAASRGSDDTAHHGGYSAVRDEKSAVCDNVRSIPKPTVKMIQINCIKCSTNEELDCLEEKLKNMDRRNKQEAIDYINDKRNV